MNPPADAPLVALGRLGRPFQLAGAQRFHPLGALEAEAVLTLPELVVEGLGPSRVRSARRHGNALLLHLARVGSREAAQGLVNRRVLVPASALPEGDLRDRDRLVGLPLELNGVRWGEVAEVLDAGGQQLLVVRGEAGSAMVPLGAPYVRVGSDRVALENPPAGLLEP